eukprot:CAMPEP_0115471140 /NCGR_PEP_ID=MMETSP0271-20121206/52369_1 /TAXON_ID=71861 /ORGANISM="Scrippsiella trochoidea, Strain CCMP3099" /LENGTH=165 /DNA_ID=CAMNT_0002898315 /DNA_START=11 /DNA_END=506 /DNA_ORIENTATION=+
MARGLLRALLATSFEDDDLSQMEEDNSEFSEVDGGIVKDIKDMNLGPDADTLPLCEDLNPETVGMGESCWSTCGGQCVNDVLKPGLTFDFDEIGLNHPGCTSHFECIGNKDRVLCHAIRPAEAALPNPAASVLLEGLAQAALAYTGHPSTAAACAATRSWPDAPP